MILKGHIVVYLNDHSCEAQMSEMDVSNQTSFPRSVSFSLHERRVIVSVTSGVEAIS